MIDRIAYDDEVHNLWVSFRQTGKYVYFDVPAEIFEGMCKAGSLGGFFNAHIKGRFQCRRDPERKRYGPNT